MVLPDFRHVAVAPDYTPRERRWAAREAAALWLLSLGALAWLIRAAY
jgi:hypothetical protein